MPNRKTDSRGFTTENPDSERDNAAKGGPAIGTGIADGRHAVSSPYNEDLQTQIAAKGRKNNHKEHKNKNKQ